MEPLTNKPRPHEVVAAAVRSRIESGSWREGQMIPSRRRLAAEYGVALTTVERAVSTLISEGQLRADDRRGTFVAEQTGEAAAVWERSRVSEQRKVLQGTVGIIASVVPYVTKDFHEKQWPLQILHGCEHQLASEPGLTIDFRSRVVHGERDRTVDELVQQLLAAEVEGVVFIGCKLTPSVLANLVSAQMPAVLATFDPAPVSLPQVYIDSTAGGASAVRHLIVRGYQQFLYFRPFSTAWTEERLAGVKSEIAGLGLSSHLLRVEPGNPDTEVPPTQDQRSAAREVADHILASSPLLPNTGVIAPNDTIATGFVEAASAHGLEVGRDYGIVGFDDRARDIGLTSLRPPLEMMGEEAIRLLLGQLHGDGGETRVALQHRLIARPSTSRPVDGGSLQSLLSNETRSNAPS